MNPYVVEGVLRDVRAGKRVVVFSSDQVGAKHAHKTMARHVDEAEPAVKVWRTNGDERIQIGQGVVSFHTIRGEGVGRGRTADVVFIDADATAEQLESIMWMTFTTGGDVVHR